MEKDKLLTYSIMALDTEYIDEICDDIKRQYDMGISGCALFKMTLVPEGKIPVNKAEIFCKEYMKFKKVLDKQGIPNGILVQATMGHGWSVNEMFPYQRFTNLTDGEQPAIVCPYDEGFREYLYNAFVTITKCNPDMIMVDDDFRLLIHGGKGCACPLHMKRFNELMGTKLSRVDLVSEIEKDTELGRKYYEVFVKTQRESLIETASVMRKAIDSVNPKQQGSFCCVGDIVEFADEITEILSGEGNPRIVRINNAAYCKSDIKEVTESFYKGASQIQKLKPYADYILAETDTCPQNRYSTSASMLHTHYTGSILEGAMGAKQWITRLASFEPESGKAYREKLAKYSKFYEELARITDEIKWCGFNMPIYQTPQYSYHNEWYDKNFWYSCALNRLGLPVYFSGENSGIICMEGDRHLSYSDEEIKSMLKGCMFLASDTAMGLIKRGFSEYIGADVIEYQGKTPTSEVFSNGRSCGVQRDFKKIIPKSDKVVELSTVYNIVGDRKERLCPGVILYENPLGGKIYTFSGTPKAPFELGSIFSFLNASRKAQFVEIAKKANQLPVYHPGDEEIYLKVGTTQDNKLLCAMFNIGFDKIENVELVIADGANKIECLDCDGNWKKLGFEVKDGKYVVDAECNVLEPVILLITK